MKIKLLINGLSKLILGFLLITALLFLPAGTCYYIQAWVFLALMFVPMIIMGTWLYIFHPKLLSKRLNNNEKEQQQKNVVALSGMMFIAGFVLCGLDYRFAWSSIPLWITIVASIFFLIGYVIYIEVMHENAYLSRTIEVQEGQQLIDTGLYGIVRHPMYTATISMFISIPLILGSLWSMIIFGVYPILIVLRINSEEKLLAMELKGYIDYQKRVKWRLLPFVW
ncbi:MAG: isoprenylcysteine carboxylmethyltransferase family protein [Paludibacteraceae bacterium]|jgi:protein-S-isoprenylcysteine O-methyltransferase Ste14|nr:isoprenylcysteine carboxylmethyltransferase family protein [Paludibacteraceae bacterium]